MSFLANLIGSFVRSRRRALAIHDLETLSPDQLNDIGFSPDGLDRVVDGLLGPGDRGSHGRRMNSLIGTHPLAGPISGPICGPISGMNLRTCG